MAHRITRMLKVTLPNFKMPSDFSVKSYEACYSQAVQKAEITPNSAQWMSQFSLAWLAVAYRFRSCAEYDRSFTASLRRAGASLGEPERYEQERDLYNFFVSGLSALESLGYGLYFIGFALDPIPFKLAASANDHKKIDLKNTVGPHFARSSFAKEKIAIDVNNLVHLPDYEQWEQIRNMLCHRITPVRTGVYHFVNSLDPDYSEPTYSHHVTWLAGLRIDEQTTETLRT